MSDIRAGDDDDQWRTNRLEKRDQHVAASDVSPFLPVVSSFRLQGASRKLHPQKQSRDGQRADGGEKECARGTGGSAIRSSQYNDREQRDSRKHMLNDRRGNL